MVKEPINVITNNYWLFFQIYILLVKGMKVFMCRVTILPNHGIKIFHVSCIIFSWLFIIPHFGQA